MVIHNGQLYIAVGDTGANAAIPKNKYGSCLNKPNGKILRVNLDGTVPADNPLSNVAEVTACASPDSGATQAHQSVATSSASGRTSAAGRPSRSARARPSYGSNAPLRESLWPRPTV